MSDSQKGVGRGTRGTKHKLVIDKTVAGDSRRRSTNLAMAWIDYKKAYDSVPHSWILECLELFKIHPSIREFIATSMNHWKIRLVANNQDIDTANIQRGIYQGDILSPLLFCIALNPLSTLLAESKCAYRFKDGTTINHLFYIDDIKLYAKNEREIDSLIHLTRVFSDDIGMSFGLSKCAARCSQLASKGYTESHNQVASIVRRAICEWYGVSQPTEWWELPKKVIEPKFSGTSTSGQTSR